MSITGLVRYSVLSIIIIYVIYHMLLAKFKNLFNLYKLILFSLCICIKIFLKVG